MEQNKGRSRARRIVIILLAAVMLISGGLSLHSYLEDKRTQEEYERLAELARETTAPVETETPPAPVETEPEKPYVSPIHFEELMEENPDTVGWIKVPDTNIDYPIVQGTDNDFYLNHDFYGKESVGGSIYLDFESQGDFVGRNNILYGHNMKNGSMFKDVIYYKDEKYFKEHQYFTRRTVRLSLRQLPAITGRQSPLYARRGLNPRNPLTHLYMRWLSHVHLQRMLHIRQGHCIPWLPAATR